MVEVVFAPNWTIVPPASPLVGLLPPLQLAALDQTPLVGPIHVCVAPSAGAAPRSASAKRTAIEIPQRQFRIISQNDLTHRFRRRFGLMFLGVLSLGRGRADGRGQCDDGCG